MCPITESETQKYNPAKASEVILRAGADWRLHAYDQSMQGDVPVYLSTETDEQNQRVIAACALDMQALWTHDFVQKCLRDAGILLEKQPGL